MQYFGQKIKAVNIERLVPRCMAESSPILAKTHALYCQRMTRPFSSGQGPVQTTFDHEFVQWEHITSYFTPGIFRTISNLQKNPGEVGRD